MNRQIRGHHLLLLAVLSGILATWYFGRMRPIKIVEHAQQQDVPCTTCEGSGRETCRTCGGSSSVQTAQTCQKCRGSGEHEWHLKSRASKTLTQSEPSCMICRGSGRVPARSRCSGCAEGQVPCADCGGTGELRHSVVSSSVVMSHSLWERILLRLRIPVSPNPRPQRRDDGTYPIVAEFVRLKSAQRRCYISKWGDFGQRGPEWVMTGTVEFVGRNGESEARLIEFVVEERELKTTRAVQ